MCPCAIIGAARAHEGEQRLKLSVHHDPRLPPLAWLATVARQDARVSVLGGRWVEAGGHFFLEGAWAGDFAAGDLDRTECVFGSGAVVRDQSVIFVPCLATTDYLYWREPDEGRVLVSNSLPFLLSASADTLDARCGEYAAINRSIMLGFREYIPEIPTVRERVLRLIHQNLRVSSAGVSVEAKPPPPRFASFADYRGYLDDSCRQLLANARDPRRRHSMAVVSTQSRGYDTTAVNAIAGKYGLDRVLTIANAKPLGTFSTRGVEQADDDGTEICQRLGITNVVRLDRNEFSRAGAEDERLLYATLDDAEDANFFPICRHLPDAPSLLLTGTLGEMWYPRATYMQWLEPNSDTDLPRWDLGTHALTELRLARGFVQAAIPYLGARHRADIFRISDSEEMRPWHVEGRYNRPIPRRIGEEAGLARDAFGRQKMATVVGFPPPQIPWNDELRREYRAFLRRHRLLGTAGWSLLPVVHAWNSAVIFATPTKNRLLHYAGRLLLRFGRRDAQLPLLGRPLAGRLFCFAANRRAADYAAALRDAPIGRSPGPTMAP